MSQPSSKHEHVVALLAEIAKHQQKCNEARQKLQSLPEFNAIQLFRMLTDTEEVLPEHFEWFFEDKVVRTTSEERDLLFQEFDRDQDGALSWAEFLNYCIGKDYAPDNNHFVTSWRDARTPSLPVQFAFMDVLVAEIDGLIIIKDLKEVVNEHLTESDWRAIFESIDQERQGCLTLTNIHDFLKSHLTSTSQTDAELIFKKLDINKDGFIDFQEFLSLKSFGKLNQPGSTEEYQSSQNLPKAPNGLTSIPGPSTDSSRWFQSHNSWRGSGHKEGSKGITMRSTAEKTWNRTGYLNSAGKSTKKNTARYFPRTKIPRESTQTNPHPRKTPKSQTTQ